MKNLPSLLHNAYKDTINLSLPNVNSWYKKEDILCICVHWFKASYHTGIDKNYEKNLPFLLHNAYKDTINLSLSNANSRYKSVVYLSKKINILLSVLKSTIPHVLNKKLRKI